MLLVNAAAICMNPADVYDALPAAVHVAPPAAVHDDPSAAVHDAPPATVHDAPPAAVHDVPLLLCWNSLYEQHIVLLNVVLVKELLLLCDAFSAGV